MYFETWHVSEKKKNNILCIPVLKQWYGMHAPLTTTTLATLFHTSNLKKSPTKDTAKRKTLPAWRIAVWPLKKKTWKPSSLEKNKNPTRISTGRLRLFLPIHEWLVIVFGGKGIGKQKYHAYWSVWVWQNLINLKLRAVWGIDSVPKVLSCLLEENYVAFLLFSFVSQWQARAKEYVDVQRVWWNISDISIYTWMFFLLGS